MNKKSLIVLGALAIMLAAFLWAFDGVVYIPWIMGLGLFDVPTIVFMLHAIGSLFLLFFFFKKKSETKNLQPSDWGAFWLTALFGGAIGTMAIVAAIIKVHSAHLNISVILLLQKLQPIFAVLLAYIILKERPAKKFYLWVIVALAGSYFLTFGFAKPDLSAQGMLIPALLALLAAFSFGSSTVFSKKAISKISFQLGTALRFMLTTLVMAIIILIIAGLNSAGVDTSYAGFDGFKSINPQLIFLFIIIALTTGATAIFIYYWGLKRVMASKATIFELFFPISAILLEYFIHGQVLTVGQWTGAIVMFVAIFFIVNLRTQSLPTSS